MANLTTTRLDTTGHLIVPPQIGASYSISIYDSATSTIEVARSPVVYLNGATPTYRKVLSASPVDSSNSASVGVPIQVTCGMPDKPQGTFSIPYTITSLIVATDGNGHLIGSGTNVSNTDGNGNVVSYTDGYGNIVGYTAAQLGVTSLTGVFNLDYTGNPVDGLMTITVDPSVTVTQESKVTVKLTNNPAINLFFKVSKASSYSVTSSTTTLLPLSISPVSVCNITVTCVNIPDGTELPYALVGTPELLPADVDIPLTGILIVTNSIATLAIKSLTTETKMVKFKLNDLNTSVVLKLTSFTDIKDGVIVDKITHANVIDTNFDMSNFNYNINVSPVYVNVDMGNTYNYSADISFDTLGYTISRGTSILIGLLKGTVTSYSWGADSSITSFKDAVDSLVATINSDTAGYTAVSKGTVGTVSTIRISRTGLDYFVAFNLVNFNTLSVGDNEIAYKLSPKAAMVGIGSLVKIVTPDEYLVDGTPTPNPYARNTGLWKIKNILGDYVVLGDKLSYTGTVVTDTSFGTYTVLK